MAVCWQLTHPIDVAALSYVVIGTQPLFQGSVQVRQ